VYVAINDIKAEEKYTHVFRESFYFFQVVNVSPLTGRVLGGFGVSGIVTDQSYQVNFHSITIDMIFTVTPQ